MDTWDDLLLSGGFAPREILLRNLTAEQAGLRPDSAPHSIYQELWYAAMAQHITLDGGQTALGRWPYEEHFPESPAPGSQTEWGELVQMFLADSQRAVSLSHEAGWLDSSEPEALALTWRDALAFVAVHSAYHLGRIVLLRQLMHLWPPRKDTTGAGLPGGNAQESEGKA